MTPALLVVSHLTCVFLTSIVTRYLVIRKLRLREVEGHTVLEVNHDRDHRLGVSMTTSSQRPPRTPEEAEFRRRAARRASDRVVIVSIVASLVVIAMGVSFLFAQRADADRRQAEASRRESIAAQTACVNRFLTSLATTYTVRADAATRLEQAQSDKDAANDAVILTVFRARQTPPVATARDFDRALEQFARAKARLERVKGQVATIRENTPLPDVPRKVCP